MLKDLHGLYMGVSLLIAGAGYCICLLLFIVELVLGALRIVERGAITESSFMEFFSILGGAGIGLLLLGFLVGGLAYGAYYLLEKILGPTEGHQQEIQKLQDEKAKLQKENEQLRRRK